MPHAVIAGLPTDADRRIESALKQRDYPFPATWQLARIRSKGRLPGLAPSQLEEARQIASQSGGAHLLTLRSNEKHQDDLIRGAIVPYFRFRWLEQSLLKLIPHFMDKWFQVINDILEEELKWIEAVKPKNESSCLLLPECSFSAEPNVRHLWSAATEAGIERIKLAAQACERFSAVHWLAKKSGPRKWIDSKGVIFDHQGQRHGVAPFPRSWKFSYQLVNGFHYDVTSRDSRTFRIETADGTRHTVSALGHVNIDPYGYVRN